MRAEPRKTSFSIDPRCSERPGILEATTFSVPAPLERWGQGKRQLNHELDRKLKPKPGLAGPQLLFQAQGWQGSRGYRAGGCSQPAGQAAVGTEREEEAEQNRYLVSWLLVLLWGWDLVESVELDSE